MPRVDRDAEPVDAQADENHDDHGERQFLLTRVQLHHGSRYLSRLIGLTQFLPNVLRSPAWSSAARGGTGGGAGADLAGAEA